MTPTIHRLLRALGVSALLAAPALGQTVNDTALFTAVVPPNVMLLVDNSGSMNHVVWHGAFDPNAISTCNYWDNATDYFVDPVDSDTFPSGASDTSFRAGTYTISSTGCVNTSRAIFYDSEVWADGRDTRWDGRYLNWYFSAAADLYAAQIAATNNGTTSACLGGGTFPIYRRSRVTAAKTVLREVICQVNAAGKVRIGLAHFRRGSDPNGGYVVVPVNDYLTAAGTPNVYTLNSVSQSHGAHLDTAITNLTGEAWTPVGESLFQVYTYFHGRGAGEQPAPASSGSFPVYQYTTSTTSGNGGPQNSSGPPTVPDSPVQYDCQKNFVIVITDGEPTRDDFDVESPSSTAAGFSSFTNLIGDYNNDGENETVIPASCNCDSSVSEGALYLDDIAKFMHEVDFRPDLPDTNGVKQTIDVYTVGFSTNAFANALLQKTAQVGGGQFYTSNDPQELATDIVSAVSDIVRKSQSFTAATVPAARTAAGGMFYTSRFVPSSQDGFWEGHLEAWKINVNGHILDANGNCALNDPDAPAECSLGSFRSSAVPFWDAGQVLSSASVSSRQLYYTHIDAISGKPQEEAFDIGGVLLPGDLGVTSADIPTYNWAPHPVPVTDVDLTQAIVGAVRGCELGTFGSLCPERTWTLGDLFHSDPVVVPGPPALNREPGHPAFRKAYETRRRFIIVGSNDGFLHFFDAGTWDAAAVPPAYTTGTGSEVVAWMPYQARQKVKELPRDSGVRDFYFVDGSPRVADAWFYTSPTNNTQMTNGSEWRTVLLSGMRQGGREVFALDITRPPASGVSMSPNCDNPLSDGDGDPRFPCYLWEFPRENAPAADHAIMGETWSEPVITKIRVQVNGNDNGGVGFDRWVAIFGTGYDVRSNPNDKGAYDALSRAGRALVIVDVQTGEVIAKKEFDPAGTAASTTDPATVTYNASDPERSMHFAFAATPSVFDVNNDGYADVIYAADLGGNIWKWVIKGIAHDSVNSGTKDYDQNGTWTFSRFFTAPSYLDSGTGQRWFKNFFFSPTGVWKNGNLWLVAGTGERANLPFAGFSGTTLDNNRFYSVVDTDVLGNAGVPATITEADLVDISAVAGCANVSAFKGFYFLGADGEKWVTSTDILGYYAFAASYTPTGAATPCTSGGTAQIYAFTAYCGEGLFTGPAGSGTSGSGSSTPPSARSVSIGTGLPTAPNITVTSAPGGESTIVVNNQAGDIIDPNRPQCLAPPCQEACDPVKTPNCLNVPKGGSLYWRLLDD